MRKDPELKAGGFLVRWYATGGRRESYHATLQSALIEKAETDTISEGYRAEIVEVMPSIDPNVSARNRQLAAIRAASPMRPVDGRTAAIDGLALFDAVRSPAML